MILNFKSYKIKELNFIGLVSNDMKDTGFKELLFVIYDKVIAITEDDKLFVLEGNRGKYIDTAPILHSTYVISYTLWSIKHPTTPKQFIALSQSPHKEWAILFAKARSPLRIATTKEEALEWLL